MKVRLKDREFSICPALAIIACNLISYCDDYNLPFFINDSSENHIDFSTHGWTEQLIFKYQHTVKRDYSDLSMVNAGFCIIGESNIIITVDINANTNKFSKGK